jgi:lysozyme
VASKKSRRRFLRLFIIVSVVSSACFIFYLGYLWWQSRQLQFVRYPEFGIPMPAEYEIHGIDVSRYQQNISWDLVREMNVRDIRLQFAFIKATEGIGNIDPYFKRNWRKSKQAGMIRGAYHFFIATKDGKLQAQNFIKNVNLESGDLPPVLDIEHLYTSKHDQLRMDIEHVYTSKHDQLRMELKEWLDVVENYYHVRPIIYTYLDFYDKNLKGYFDDYPLWVAHYLQPHQPRINRDWTFWQHSEQGRVNGIASKVDFNVFNGDSISFKGLLVP